MKLMIVIDGESADELYAVGPKDLISHFLPKHLNIKKKDVIKLCFEELTREGKCIDFSEAFSSSKPYEIKTHPDNYKRKREKEGK